MTEKRTPKAAARDSEVIGARIRQARLDRRLSLQDVEALTDGAIKTPTLSAYELGNSNITVVRLRQLAELYKVSLDELVPHSESPKVEPSEPDPVPSPGTRVHIDLTQLHKAKGPEADAVKRFVGYARNHRSSKSGRYFVMRNEDFVTAAAFAQREVDEVMAALHRSGVLRPPRGRPLGRRT